MEQNTKNLNLTADSIVPLSPHVDDDNFFDLYYYWKILNGATFYAFFCSFILAL